MRTNEVKKKKFDKRTSKIMLKIRFSSNGFKPAVQGTQLTVFCQIAMDKRVIY